MENHLSESRRDECFAPVSSCGDEAACRIPHIRMKAGRMTVWNVRLKIHDPTGEIYYLSFT